MRESSVFRVGHREKYKKSTIRNTLQNLLLPDITWLYLAFFGIAVAEANNLEEDQNVTIFKILFEITSAYGTVGLSLGNASNSMHFCSLWTRTSKVMLTGVMLLGRHRGLPESIDHAVKLPELEQHIPEVIDEDVALVSESE